MQRRLDVGGVIRRVWDIYVGQAPVLMPAAAVVFVISGLLSAVLESAGTLSSLLLALVISLLAETVFTGMVVMLVADVQDGRRDSSAGQLLRAVTPVLGQLVLVAIVFGFALLIGFFLFVVPGLYLLTVWSLFAPVIVLERPPGLSALSRSRELVRGNGWQVFAVILVLLVLVVVFASALEAVAESAGMGVGIVVRVIVGVLTTPISALATAVLYFELRRISGERADVLDAGVGPDGVG
jgi:hypothetical protein